MEISRKNIEEVQKSNEICEKVIQIILCLQIPAHTVIEAINSYVYVEQDESFFGPSEDEQPSIYKLKINERQSSICQFVYTYLLHNIQYVSLKGDQEGRQFAEGVQKEDEFRDEKIKLYRQVIDLVEKFKKQRHPNTTCWLIELLHILTSKFTPSSGMGQESWIAKRLENLLQYLLKLCATMIESDDIIYEQWSLSDVHLNPTVYEMLKRFEFCIFKKEDQADNQHDQQDGTLYTEYTDEPFSKNDEMGMILDLAERGIGSGARGENENFNLHFTQSQLQHYYSIPNFKETIFKELENDW